MIHEEPIQYACFSRGFNPIKETDYHSHSFFGLRALRDNHMIEFFCRFRVMCLRFKLVRQISQNPDGYHDFATFSPKNSKKIRLHGFFKRIFEKNAVFQCFSSLIPYISELRDFSFLSFFILKLLWAKRDRKM